MRSARSFSTNSWEAGGSGALFWCPVDGDRRPLPGLVRKLRLRLCIEFRFFPVPTALEGQSHADAAAMLALVLGDRILQRLRHLLIPRQLVVARLVRAGQLQPQIHAVVLLQIRADDLGILHARAEHPEPRRFRPSQHIGIAEEQSTEDDREQSSYDGTARAAPRRHRHVGEGAEQDGERKEGDEEAGHERPAARRLLWMRFMLSAMSSPFSSRRKRNTVVSCPSKVSSTFDASAWRTCPC